MTQPLLFKCLGKLTNNLSLMVTLTFCYPCTSLLLFCLRWTVSSKRKKGRSCQVTSTKMKGLKYLYDCLQLSLQRLKANIFPQTPENILQAPLSKLPWISLKLLPGPGGRNTLSDINQLNHNHCNIKSADFANCIVYGLEDTAWTGWTLWWDDVSSWHVNPALAARNGVVSRERKIF